jgi:hypothetical protein
MKKYLFPGLLLLTAALLMFSGCPMVPSSNNDLPIENDEDEDPGPELPELKDLEVKPAVSTAPKVGTKITATPKYESESDENPGSVTWQWTADDVPIEGATTAEYTPVVEDFNKILKVTATPDPETTTGEAKTCTFSKVTKDSISFPGNNTRHSVKDLLEIGSKYYFFSDSETPGIFEIKQDAYNTIKLIFDKNKDNGAIRFFQFPFKSNNGVLDLNKDFDDDNAKITLTIDDSLTGTKNNPLIVTIPLIPSDYMEMDQMLYHNTPVYMTGSDSGSGADAEYVNIVIEEGGYLYICDDTKAQKFKGLIRAKRGAVVVDDGESEGYTAGADAFYWFDYGSYCWLATPEEAHGPFIATQEFFDTRAATADKPRIVWTPDRQDSFIWARDNGLLLQGKVKQVRPFALTGNLKLTPGSECIIDIPDDANKFLLLNGKSIVKWLPNPQEDYYTDLTKGGVILPEPKIHVMKGSGIKDTNATSMMQDICNSDAATLDKTWIWNPEASNSIKVDDGKITITGGWKDITPAEEP